MFSLGLRAVVDRAPTSSRESKARVAALAVSAIILRDVGAYGH